MAARRPHPRLLSLEDRVTPSAGVAPDRLLVAFGLVVPEAIRTAELRNTPGVIDFEAIGFGVYAVNLHEGQPLAVAQSKLAALSGVKSATPDAKIALAATPTDPNVGSQDWLRALKAPAAWNVSVGTGQTVVAVIDSGIDLTHPDLAANLWTNPGEVAGNGFDDDGDGIVDDVHGVNFIANTGDPSDALGHGTHVAGIIGAVGNNGVGGTGINPHARIMPLKFIGPDGGLTSNAVRAVNYAVARGAKVINQSWGGGNYDPALADAITRAARAGVIVVSSAGNYASNNDAAPFYPANYVTQADNVVTVAAANANGGLSNYSNFGATTVTLAAPGDNVLSTLPGGRYGVLSGTSMAAPMVSGAIALLWDVHPDWTYRQVLAKLRSSVTADASLVGKTITGGRLDLAKLFDAPTSPPPAVVPPPASPPATPTVASATFGGARAGQFDRVSVTFGRPVDPAAIAAVVTGPGGPVAVSAAIPVGGSNNTRFTLMFSKNQTAGGIYTLVVGSFSTTAALNGPPVAPPVSPPASPPPAPAPARTTYTAGTPRAILDQRTTRVEIYVSGSQIVSNLAVTLDAVHGRVGDLSIRLTAPDGRKVTLFNRRGAQGSNLSNTTFRDGSTALAGGSAPFGGSYRPEQPLSTFDGANARGIWVLEIFDLVAGVSGTLTRASLSFGGAAGSQSIDPSGFLANPTSLASKKDWRNPADPRRTD
jgi:subtilisin family serine protease/subtilisin-like proprotein convertase family protein